MPRPDAGRKRAQRLFPALGICTECGSKPAVERHHRDGDTENNAPDNVTPVCRRCHMILDGRLAQLTGRGHEGGVASGVARRRDVCRNGHPQTPENLYVRPNGARVCLICRREQDARWHREKRRV